jgi:TonB family protein
MNALMYLLQVNLYLLLFYLLYLVLLRNETFFKMNRFYLVGSALLSLAVPLMKLQWVNELFLGDQVFQVTQKVSQVMIEGTAKTPGNLSISPQYEFTATTGITNIQILGIIYVSVTIMFLLNFLKNLYFLNRTISIGSKRQAFSFFKIVSVDQELGNKETIMNHEMVHVRQWHSVDVIFFEIFTAFNWFNPIAFLYKRAIRNIHEFIADETAALALEDKSAYTLLLVSNVFGTEPQQLTNSFFNQSLLKRRIIMLHKTKSRQVAILKYGLSVPLFALMIIISSATIGKSQQVVDVTEELKAKVSQILSPEPTTTAGSGSAKALAKAPSKDNRQSVAHLLSDEPQPLDYKKVDVVAEFPGGVQSLYEWFKAKFEYPQTAKNQGMDERMIATFIIEKDGSLSNIKVVQDAGLGTKEIALALLQKSPKWSPAKLKGLPVRMSYNLPVNLKISEMHTVGSWALKKNTYPKSKNDTLIAYFKNDRISFSVPSSATYPGGLTAFNKFLNENLKFPEEAKKNKITGLVTVSFTVNKDGTLENIEVSTPLGYGCDEEAIRLVKISGKWNPAKYDDDTLERTGESVDIIFQSSKE